MQEVNSHFNLGRKVVLITGASSGIGAVDGHFAG
jgi:NADP-dependent 3-hydroxy acid dehydrogenase YdfG